MIKNAGGYLVADRLGSIGHFYPYGLEKPSATTNGTEKFTGYLRDAETGNDYAINRYHVPGTGQFLTPDPYIASAGPTDPGSWNRYAYTRGDPVNRYDHLGTCDSDSFSTDGYDDDCMGGGMTGGGGGGDDGSCFGDDFYTNPECGSPTQGTTTSSGSSGGSTCPSYTSATNTFYTCFHQSGSDWKKLTNNLKTIDKKLQKDPQCEKVLTSNGVTMNEINNDLLNPQGTFTLAGTIVSLTNNQIFAGTTGDVPSQTPIIINSYVYMNASQGQDFLTILHELAHLVNVIAGDGPTGSTTSGSNDDTVLANCGKTIGRLQ